MGKFQSRLFLARVVCALKPGCLERSYHVLFVAFFHLLNCCAGAALLWITLMSFIGSVNELKRWEPCKSLVRALFRLDNFTWPVFTPETRSGSDNDYVVSHVRNNLVGRVKRKKQYCTLFPTLRNSEMAQPTLLPSLKLQRLEVPLIHH